MKRLLRFAFLTLLLCGVPLVAQERTPQAVADELLAADRDFSTASAQTDLAAGLVAMFTEDVVMMAPGGMVHGKAAAIEALRAIAGSLTSRIRWTPRRVGVSADGQQGFTFGFTVVDGPEGKRTAGKYLAYWVKQPAGWRVAAYKSVRTAGDSPAPAALMAPSLPSTLAPPSTDAAATRRFAESLTAAEAAFSNDAQSIGLGPAFVKYGSADAINLGGSRLPDFVVGNEAIGKFIGEGSPAPKSPLSWGADRVIVASSGDLGVSIGTIRQNTPAASGPQTFPFFTIWRRASASEPWRYIAE